MNGAPFEVGDRTQPPVVRALLLPVAHDWYAVDLAQVREVVAAPMVTELPTARPPLLGVFNLRGEIVPLFDTAALVGIGRARSADFAVVVDGELGPAGLASSGMPEATELPQPLSAAESSLASLTYAVGRRVVTLVDVHARLHPSPREGRNGRA